MEHKSRDLSSVEKTYLKKAKNGHPANDSFEWNWEQKTIQYCPHKKTTELVAVRVKEAADQTNSSVESRGHHHTDQVDKGTAAYQIRKMKTSGAEKKNRQKAGLYST